MRSRVAFLAGMTVVVGACATERASAQFLTEQRVQVVDYVADQVVAIAGAPGQQTTIELAPDEAIQTVAVGDSGAWAVTVPRDGRRLYVKPAQGGATNMTVVTNARRYLFALGGDRGAAPFVVRFRYSARIPDTFPDPALAAGLYIVSGARPLRPMAMYDDGIHTYIEWPLEAALPAVFAQDRLGRETVVNGAMRGQFYVLDSIADHLIFRVDRSIARAERTLPRKARRR